MLPTNDTVPAPEGLPSQQKADLSIDAQDTFGCDLLSSAYIRATPAATSVSKSSAQQEDRASGQNLVLLYLL